MKVIRMGKVRQIECYKCKSLLEYDIEKDTKTSDVYMFSVDAYSCRPYKYIRCPVCGNEINVCEDYYNYFDAHITAG